MSSKKLEDMLMPLPQRQTYTSREVMAVLGISRPTFRRMVQTGALIPVQLINGDPGGHHRLYHRAQVDAILNAWRGEPAAAVPEAGLRVLEGGRGR